jgi:siroheme synthase
MRAGRPASFPVAVVERASLAEQQVHHTNLAGLVELLGARSVRSPALLVVGEVAAVDLTAVVPAFDAASRIPA